MTSTGGNVYRVYPNSQLLTGGMNNPIGCVVRNGILYVVDAGNNRVMTINLSNNSTGVFGSLPANCRYIAIDSTGNVYVGCDNGWIYKISSGGGGSSQWYNAGGNIRGMDIDSSNILYYCNANSIAIVNTSNAQSAGGVTGVIGSNITGCAVKPDGSSVYWTDTNRGGVFSNTGLSVGGSGSGQYGGDVSAFADSSSNFRYVYDCKMDATGKFLYVVKRGYDVNDYSLSAIVLP
jgi:sugar lactone lactonase YvrE